MFLPPNTATKTVLLIARPDIGVRRLTFWPVVACGGLLCGLLAVQDCRGQQSCTEPGKYPVRHSVDDSRPPANDSVLGYEFADPAHAERYSADGAPGSGGDVAPPGRYKGPGDPLFYSSWLNRPWDVGWFVGGMQGDTLITGIEDQGVDLFGGFRLGWDMGHYWGGETRFAWTSLPLEDASTASADQHRDSVFYWDVDALYYPWGDSRWRPYVSLGLGLSSFGFTDLTGQRHDEALVAVPIGGGVKYLVRDWLALRADITDNIAIGGNSSLNTMNNVSITCGMEFRFGGSRPSYYPWNSCQHIW